MKSKFLNFGFLAVFILQLPQQAFSATSPGTDCKEKLATVGEAAPSKVIKGERLYKTEGENYSLDKNTRNDLKVLDRVYPQLNKSRTYFGATRLAWLLQNPYLSVEEIQQRQKAVQELISNQQLREAVSSSLHNLKSAADETFSDYFDGLKETYSPVMKPFSYIGLFITGGAIAAAITAGWKVAGQMLMPMMMFNAQVMTKLRMERQTLQDFKIILQEGDVLAKALSSSNSTALKDIKGALDAIEDSSHPSSPVLSLKSLKRMLGPKNPFALAVDFLYGQGDRTLVSTQKKIIADKEKLAILISAIAELDVYAALADYSIENQGKVVFPQVLDSPKSQFSLVDAHNPYLFGKNPETSVPNSITMNGSKVSGPNFVVLTGPNAGGKSTFLKTVALTSITAQIGAPVPAKAYLFTPMEVKTNIDLSDSLEEGKSFYRAEGARLSQIANRAQQPEKLLVIMDEILLGTNPKDRQALEKQVIRFLAQTAHLSLLATHDIEVTKLAEEQPGILNLKVDEIRDPQTGDFRFTFKMVPGVSQTSTAFEVLKAEGVPSAIVDEAYKERYGNSNDPRF